MEKTFRVQKSGSCLGLYSPWLLYSGNKYLFNFVKRRILEHQTSFGQALKQNFGIKWPPILD